MIKLVVFDLDGVLLDARQLHFESLNQALSEFGLAPLTQEEHTLGYDGLPTWRKLDLLTKQRGLDPSLHVAIWGRKQDLTRSGIVQLRPPTGVVECLRALNLEGMRVAVASNATWATVDLAIRASGLEGLVQYVYSADDVSQPKPHPMIYQKVMLAAGVAPDETLVIEDSPAGREAAVRSGAYLFPVDSPADVCHKSLCRHMAACGPSQRRWSDRNLDVLVPMAGVGSRFADKGYTLPKYLLPVAGRPVIEWVVESLAIDARYIFLVQEDHRQHYCLDYLLRRLAPNCEVVGVHGPTDGAVSTTLLARHLLGERSLLIVNSDQYLEWSPSKFMYQMRLSGVDGGILTFPASNPCWSYARMGSDGWVVEVAEKRVISDRATVGVYYWKTAHEYLSCADEMVRRNDRVNGEFYVCPVYNEALRRGSKVLTHDVPRMVGLGTPEDYECFRLERELSK